MIKTTMKIVEELGEDAGPDEVATHLANLSDKCYSAFGNGGSLKTLKLEHAKDGTLVLIAIAEVEG